MACKKSAEQLGRLTTKVDHNGTGLRRIGVDHRNNEIPGQRLHRTVGTRLTSEGSLVRTQLRPPARTLQWKLGHVLSRFRAVAALPLAAGVARALVVASTTGVARCVGGHEVGGCLAGAEQG